MRVDAGIPEIESVLNSLDETIKIVPEIAKSCKIVLPPNLKILKEWHQKFVDQQRHSTQRFTIIVLGEYNAGKSTFLNALFDLPEDGQHLPTSDVPTNARPIRLVFRDTDVPEAKIVYFSGNEEILSWDTAVKEAVENTLTRNKDVREIVLSLDNDLLRGVDILDMPGTGSGWNKEHQDITRNYIENAEAVLWVIGCDEPSMVGYQDYKIAQRVKIPIQPVFNAWGYLDSKRNSQLGINQDEIEAAVKRNFPDLFENSSGFRVYSQKHIDSRKTKKELPEDDFGLQIFRTYLNETFISSAIDTAERRRLNVKNQVARIARETRLQLNENTDRWENEISRISVDNENIQNLKTSENRLEHRIRSKLRSLADDCAETITTTTLRQTELFIDEYITVDHMRHLFPFTKNKIQSFEADLKTKLENYLHLNKSDNWLEKEIHQYLESCWVVLEAEWREFIQEIPLDFGNQATGFTKPDLPFDQFSKSALAGVGEIIKRMLVVGGILGILLLIPGGVIVDAVIGVALIMVASFSDPFKEPRERAKRRFRNEIGFQRSGIKKGLLDVAMTQCHAKLKTTFEEQLGIRGKVAKELESLLSQGLMQLNDLDRALEFSAGDENDKGNQS